MTVDLTGIAVSVTGGIFSVLGIVLTAFIQAHMSNQAAAATVSAAVKNSLGAMQQAAEAAEKNGIKPVTIPIANVPPALSVGVQYVLDHAGQEAAQINITPAAIADKINAQIGLASISSNIAAAGSDAPTPAPLAVVPVGAVAPAKAA